MSGLEYSALWSVAAFGGAIISDLAGRVTLQALAYPLSFVVEDVPPFLFNTDSQGNEVPKFQVSDPPIDIQYVATTTTATATTTITQYATPDGKKIAQELYRQAVTGATQSIHDTADSLQNLYMTNDTALVILWAAIFFLLWLIYKCWSAGARQRRQKKLERDDAAATAQKIQTLEINQKTEAEKNGKHQTEMEGFMDRIMTMIKSIVPQSPETAASVNAELTAGSENGMRGNAAVETPNLNAAVVDDSIAVDPEAVRHGTTDAVTPQSPVLTPEASDPDNDADADKRLHRLVLHTDAEWLALDSQASSQMQSEAQPVDQTDDQADWQTDAHAANAEDRVVSRVTEDDDKTSEHDSDNFSTNSTNSAMPAPEVVSEVKPEVKSEVEPEIQPEVKSDDNNGADSLEDGPGNDCDHPNPPSSVDHNIKAESFEIPSNDLTSPQQAEQQQYQGVGSEPQENAATSKISAKILVTPPYIFEDKFPSVVFDVSPPQSTPEYRRVQWYRDVLAKYEAYCLAPLRQNLPADNASHNIIKMFEIETEAVQVIPEANKSKKNPDAQRSYFKNKLEEHYQRWTTVVISGKLLEEPQTIKTPVNTTPTATQPQVIHNGWKQSMKEILANQNQPKPETKQQKANREATEKQQQLRAEAAKELSETRKANKARLKPSHLHDNVGTISTQPAPSSGNSAPTLAEGAEGSLSYTSSTAQPKFASGLPMRTAKDSLFHTRKPTRKPVGTSNVKAPAQNEPVVSLSKQQQSSVVDQSEVSATPSLFGAQPFTFTNTAFVGAELPTESKKDVSDENTSTAGPSEVLAPEPAQIDTVSTQPVQITKSTQAQTAEPENDDGFAAESKARLAKSDDDEADRASGSQSICETHNTSVQPQGDAPAHDPLFSSDDEDTAQAKITKVTPRMISTESEPEEKEVEQLLQEPMPEAPAPESEPEKKEVKEPTPQQEPNQEVTAMLHRLAQHKNTFDKHIRRDQHPR